MPERKRHKKPRIGARWQTHEEKHSFCSLGSIRVYRVRDVLLRLVQAGKISTTKDLRSAYHRVIMRTHPDAVGSDKYLESFLQLRKDYEEAKSLLGKSEGVQTISEDQSRLSHRLAFFQQLQLIEDLEMPYAFHPEENVDELLFAKRRAIEELSGWRKDLVELYKKADAEYVRIKRQKPMGPYLKHALALNVRPLVHDLVAYHLTGRALYAKQAKQNLPGIMYQLTEKGCCNLHQFLSFLLEDMKSGAAVFE